MQSFFSVNERCFTKVSIQAAGKRAAGTAAKVAISKAAEAAVTKSVAATVIATIVCLPASAMVSLDNGTSIRMDELQVGDKVKTGMDIQNVCVKHEFFIHLYICSFKPQNHSILWSIVKCLTAIAITLLIDVLLIDI